MTDIFWIATWIIFFVYPLPANLVLSDAGTLGPLGFLSLPFAHGDLMHILFNFLIGFPMMKTTEKYVSKGTWLTLWLLTAFVTNYLKLYYVGLWPPAIGASGVLGAYAFPALYYAARYERARLFEASFGLIWCGTVVLANYLNEDSVIFAHGGGYVIGALYVLWDVARRLVQRFG